MVGIATGASVFIVNDDAVFNTAAITEATTSYGNNRLASNVQLARVRRSAQPLPPWSEVTGNLKVHCSRRLWGFESTCLELDVKAAGEPELY